MKESTASTASANSRNRKVPRLMMAETMLIYERLALRPITRALTFSASPPPFWLSLRSPVSSPQ